MSFEQTLVALAIAVFIIEMWAVGDPWPFYFARGIVVYRRRCCGTLDPNATKVQAALGTNCSLVETAPGRWAICEQVLRVPSYPRCMHCSAVTKGEDTVVLGYLNLSVLAFLAVPAVMGSVVGALSFSALFLLGYAVQRGKVSAIASAIDVEGSEAPAA